MNNLWKWRVLFLSIALLIFFVISLPQAEAQAWKWPGALPVGTPAVGAATHASATAWGAIMEKMTGMKVRVIPEGSEGSRMRRLLAGELTVSSVTMTEMTVYTQGDEAFVSAPKGDLRVLWHHVDTPWGWAVRGDSELKTIYDIRKLVEAGKKVRVAANTSSGSMVIWVEKALPAFLGILEREDLMKNIVYVPLGSYAANVKSIAEGKADIAMVATISAVTHEIEAHPQGLRWLDKPVADKKGWAEVIKWRPTAIPAKMGLGVKSAIGREGWLSNFVYAATAQTDPELVYQLVKWWDQNFEAYKDAHDIMPRMSVGIFREFLNYSPVPIHEGAIRYLKEIGRWTAADDVWNLESQKLMTRYVDAWKTATAGAAEKKIKIAHDNKEWEDLWNRQIKDIPVFKVRIK